MTRLLAILLVMVLAGPAQAQQQRQCGKTGDILALLDQRFNEVPAGVGLTAGGTKIVRLTLSPSGSWTMLGEVRRGVLCILGSGDGWHFAEPKPLGEPT